MLVFDFEVFPYDWLVVFKNTSTGEYKTIVNDPLELHRFYTENKTQLLVGFNNRAYDNIILRAILSGANPYEVSSVLFTTEQRHLIYKVFNIKYVELLTLDLMQDNMVMSLKELEGHMNLSIEESSVSFDIRRKLTDDEITEVAKYCRHDVDATEALLKERFSYIQSKMKLVELFSLPVVSVGKSNAQLCAEVLRSRKIFHTDEHQYDLPPEVDIKKYHSAVDMYTERELDYSNTSILTIAGIPHTLAYGGLHGALENFLYDGELWQIDASSYYPTLMIQYNYLSRNVLDPSRYEKVYSDRLAFKRTDKAKAEALKLILNTTYGAMKNEYNTLYDPKMANQVCITGQLLLVDLIEKLEPYCRLVQSNTDGILIIPTDKENILRVLEEWQKRTRVILEIDKCTNIWQKDVNNYIMVFEDGTIKTKGGYVSQYNGGLRNSMRIVDKAVVDYFLYGKSPYYTISQSTDIHDFQIIKKTGGTYQKTVWELDGIDREINKVNRIYASKEHHHGKVYKIKMVDGVEVRRDSVANLPDYCVIDNRNKLTLDQIDKQWYVDMAMKRIKDFKGEV